nr:hypothetical protein [Oceanobacillus rekensis]
MEGNHEQGYLHEDYRFPLVPFVGGIAGGLLAGALLYPQQGAYYPPYPPYPQYPPYVYYHPYYPGYYR